MDDDVSSRERSGVSAVDTRALITSLAGSVIVGGTAIVWGILSGEEDAVRRAITTRLDALGHEGGRPSSSPPTRASPRREPAQGPTGPC